MNTRDSEAIPHRPEADSFDLRKSWEYMRQAAIGHMALILLCSMLAAGLMLLYVMIWPSVYQAEVTIMAEAEDDKHRVDFYSHWNVFRTNNLRDEVNLINSRVILEKTADELGLTYDDVYHPFLSYAAHLWGESLVGKSYRKVKYAIFGRPCDPDCPSDEELLRAKMLYDFSKGVVLIPAPDSYVGNVAVRASSPRVAEIANTLTEKFLEQRKLRYLNEAQKSYDSLLAETEKAKAELVKAEQQKEAYYTENNILLEYEKDRVAVTEWMTLKSQIVEAESRQAALENSLAEVERQFEMEQRQVVGARVFTKSSRKAILQDQLVRLKMALSQTETIYTQESPEVTSILEQMNAVNEMIRSEEEMEETQFNEVLSGNYESLRQSRDSMLSQLAGVNAELEIKRAAEAQMSEEVALIPGKIKVTHAMGRDHSILEGKFVALQNKLTVAAVSLATVASAPSSIQVVDPAIPATKPSWPMKKLFLVMALLFGAFGGFMLGLLLDLIHRRVNRYYLGPDLTGDVLFATVRKDSNRLTRIFDVPPPPRPTLLERLIR